MSAGANPRWGLRESTVYSTSSRILFGNMKRADEVAEGIKWLIACNGDNDLFCPEAPGADGVRVAKGESPDGNGGTLRVFFKLNGEYADLLDIDLYRDGSDFEDES